MVAVTVFVEGGGGHDLDILCRQGFRSLCERAGLRGRMPAIVASGSRNAAWNDFIHEFERGKSYPILLVDSEDPVSDADERTGSARAWNHLLRREQHWRRPHGVADEQAQLMTTCMETWIIVDHKMLNSEFGQHLQPSALPPLAGLEHRARQAVFDALVRATSASGARAYAKGRRSYQLLALVDPATLAEHLVYFRRFVSDLKRIVDRSAR